MNISIATAHVVIACSAYLQMCTCMCMLLLLQHNIKKLLVMAYKNLQLQAIVDNTKERSKAENIKELLAGKLRTKFRA